MNATGLLDPIHIVADMTQSLLLGIRRDAVDIGDFRAIQAHLRRAGFPAGDIHSFAEQAVERARATLQIARPTFLMTIEASAFALVVAVWVVCYVGVCPA